MLHAPRRSVAAVAHVQHPVDVSPTSTTSIGSLRKRADRKIGFGGRSRSSVARAERGSIASAVSTASTVTGIFFCKSAQQPQAETRLRARAGKRSRRRPATISRGSRRRRFRAALRARRRGARARCARRRCRSWRARCRRRRADWAAAIASLPSSIARFGRKRRMRIDAPDARRRAAFRRVRAHARWRRRELRCGRRTASARARAERDCARPKASSEPRSIVSPSSAGARVLFETRTSSSAGSTRECSTTSLAAALPSLARENDGFEFVAGADHFAAGVSPARCAAAAATVRTGRRSCVRSGASRSSPAGSHASTPATSRMLPSGSGDATTASVRSSTRSPASMRPRSKASISLRRSRNGASVDAGGARGPG